VDAFAGFLDRLVGQADEEEFWRARRDLHLNVDGHGLDALERHCLDPGDHTQFPQPGPR
jgi:hypothetical protein